MSAIRRVPRKKKSKAALALRPAPWNYPPAADPRGLRHSSRSWEAELSSPAAQPGPAAATTVRRFPNGERGVKTGPFANDLWVGDHLQPGASYREIPKPLTKYDPARNLSTEQQDLPEKGRKVKRQTNMARQADQSEIPWRSDPASPSHLETPTGKPRGQRHASKAFQSSVQIPHNTSLKSKSLRQAGEVRSHADRLAACFEEGTCVRRQRPQPEGEYRLRGPFGTAHNFSVYEPLRKHTVHYDTRQLLTYG
eukprot:EG_transcript_19147